MSRKTLARRVAIVEQQQTQGDSTLAGAVAEFDRRFLRLVDHYQGRDPGPGASIAAQWAADIWHDAEALGAIRARAASAAPAPAGDGWAALREGL